MSVQIDRKEVYRYLGFRGVVPSRDIADKVEVYIKKLEEVSVPRSFCRYFPLLPAEDAQEEGGCVRFADLEIRSRNLAGNLRGCTQVCMLAVTIGIGADRLVSRAQLTDVAGAAICQAAGAAMAEAWCDEINSGIISEAARQSLYCRPRFSPGYGDFSLEHQKDFSRLLDMPKTCGITLTDSLLMVPTKSITALIGLSPEKSPCVMSGCETCSHSDTCSYRR